MKKLIALLTKRGKRGFTLVEMIVSVALIAILLSGMMLFISPVIRNFNDNSKNINAENVAYCVEEYITRSIRNASEIYIYTDTTYSVVTTNSIMTQKVKELNDNCKKYNGTATAENRTYLLKCLSLRWIDNGTGGKYILCSEKPEMNNNGKLDGNSDPLSSDNDEYKVFNDSLYKGLYSSFAFSMPDDLTAGAKEPKRDDALQLDVNYYSDKDGKNLVFKGSGITELRNIKVQLAAGAKDTEYFCKVNDFGEETPPTYTETHKDIFIYYVVRNIKTTTTTP